MPFADRLNEILTTRGFSLTDLANHLKVTPQAVGQWGRGETIPRGRRLDKIAGYLGVSVPALMAEVGEPFDNAGELISMSLTPEEVRLIKSVRSMSPENAQALFTLYGDRGKAKTDRPRRPPRPRPLVGGNDERRHAIQGCTKVVPIRAIQPSAGVGRPE